MADVLMARTVIPVGFPEAIRPFVEAGVLDRVEVQLLTRLARLVPVASDLDLLALGLASRATRAGHVCIELDHLDDSVAIEVPGDVEPVDLAWPSVATWEDSLARSPLVSADGGPGTGGRRPLVLEGRRLYLQRYWSYEMEVSRQLEQRSSRVVPGIGGAVVGSADIEETLDLLFGREEVPGSDLQRLAASRAIRHGVSVIAGGPGTGKTHTIARVLAAAHLLADRGGIEIRIALAAPTGKAAMRMRTAVLAQLEAMLAGGSLDRSLADRIVATEPSTLHRLLAGARRPGQADGLPHLPVDVVVVDETSMVALPLMSRLLEALRPDARLVLVGDPFQLASIEAGTVMSDVVGPSSASTEGAGGPLDGRVTVLNRTHRFEGDSEIAELADAIRAGDAAAVFEVLERSGGEVRWVRNDDDEGLAAVRATVSASSCRVAELAYDDPGGALQELEAVKVLAATRSGRLGRNDWGDRIERVVTAREPDAPRQGRVRVGTPIMVTTNDRANGLFNGDVGVVVQTANGLRAAIRSAEGIRELPLSRLGAWETWWAMTIHKSQGSEFRHAVVSLPAVDSPILTRELLYTAVTRGRKLVTVVASAEAIAAAVDRPVARASGLGDRLWPGS